MSTDAVAIIGFVALFVLMLLRVPVGMAMGLVGVLRLRLSDRRSGPALEARRPDLRCARRPTTTSPSSRCSC